MDWQTINNKRKRYVQMGDNLFGNMYKDVRVDFLKEIRKVERPEQIESIIEDFDFTMNMQSAYERFYTRTVKAFRDDFLTSNLSKSGYKAHYTTLETKQVPEASTNGDVIARILKFVEDSVENRISKTIETHYNDIKRVAKKAVVRGVENGLGVDDIAKDISQMQSEMDIWKARRIARTEVVTASNYGIEMGAEEIPGNKVKIWISSYAETSRGAGFNDQVDHAAMDGQEVQMNESFIEPLTGEKLRYPGDPQASIKNTIYCRCGEEIIIKATE